MTALQARWPVVLAKAHLLLNSSGIENYCRRPFGGRAGPIARWQDNCANVPRADLFPLDAARNLEPQRRRQTISVLRLITAALAFVACLGQRAPPLAAAVYSFQFSVPTGWYMEWRIAPSPRGTLLRDSFAVIDRHLRRFKYLYIYYIPSSTKGANEQRGLLG
jgi:hypothetical protein